MKHLAIIMDGNGRWATMRGLERTAGHAEGAKAVLRAVEAAEQLGLECLSLYAFSTENHRRSKREVLGIFGIIAEFLDEVLLPYAMRKGLRIRFIGDMSRITSELMSSIARVNAATINHTGMTVVIALSYGGREEVVRAVNLLIENKLLNGDYRKISYEELEPYLYTVNLPDPDAVWRFGGYQRLSGFMPLQTTYSELFFSDKLWPDFQAEDMFVLAARFAQIKRNFGEVSQ